VGRGLIGRSGGVRNVGHLSPRWVSDSAGGEEEFEKEAHGGEIRSWQ
jgi:hypothetical protein